MNTCASCRFFASPAPLEYIGDDLDDERGSEHHHCVGIIHGNATSVTLERLEEPALVTDGSGYSAMLRVLPSFGCTLHEVAK